MRKGGSQHKTSKLPVGIRLFLPFGGWHHRVERRRGKWVRAFVTKFPTITQEDDKMT